MLKSNILSSFAGKKTSYSWSCFPKTRF